MISPSLLLKRSGISHNRPDPLTVSEGELVLNYNNNSPGIFFRDSSANLIKVGPVEVSGTAPNSSASGEEGNSLGELWFDTSDSTLKVWTGSGWESCWVPPSPPLVARTYWNGNATETAITSSDTYYTLDTSTRSLDPIGAGFNLSVDHPGLVYNKTNSSYALVTMSGSHNGSSTNTFRLSLAKTPQGQTQTLPDDVIEGAIIRSKRETHGGFFITETLLQLNNGDTVYPVVMCEGDNQNTAIESLTMTIRAL